MSELIGAIVGNRYRLSAPWTHADVYRARDLQLERNVAITIARTYDETRATPALFEVRQTAQLAARLSHPNILEVLDFGQEGELCYLVTPLAEGGSLRDRLSGKPLPLDAVTRILQPLTDALSWAHSRQPSIVHGNLTPDHILFTQDERMLLSGVGSMGNASSSPLGDITALTTAPEYLSPEQADGALADAHSDIYALGIILYELLDGAAPFRGASPAQTFELHRHAPLPPLSQRNPAVTQQVEWIIARALAKRPADRFASVSELWAHWQAAVATHPSTFLPVPTASVLPVPASPTSPIA